MCASCKKNDRRDRQAVLAGEEGKKEEDIALEGASEVAHGFCPITQALMTDPVVHPHSGESYERNAIVERDGSLLYYPNRALKEYIDSITGDRTELQQNVKREIFLCPITCDLVRDPVIDPEGNSYERNAISDWIEKHNTSPITRNPLRKSQLYDNKALFEVLFDMVQSDSSFVDQHWKEDISSPSSHQPEETKGTMWSLLDPEAPTENRSSTNLSVLPDTQRDSADLPATQTTPEPTQRRFNLLVCLFTLLPISIFTLLAVFGVVPRYWASIFVVIIILVLIILAPCCWCNM